jgi:hypothetical protein
MLVLQLNEHNDPSDNSAAQQIATSSRTTVVVCYVRNNHHIGNIFDLKKPAPISKHTISVIISLAKV